MSTNIDEKIKKTEAEIEKLKAERIKQGYDGINSSDCLNRSLSPTVTNLDIRLYDLQQIDKAVKTLLMYVFGDPYNGRGNASHLDFYKDEADDISNGLGSLRKIQRLFERIDANGYDLEEIGISFKKVEP